MACGLVGQAAFSSFVPPEAQVFSVKEFLEFRLTPRISVVGATGSYTMGKAQLLTPFYGDSTQVLYGFAEGAKASGDSGWIGGVGTGYRKIINDLIFGGYVIADYNTSSNDMSFWIANPGIEVLGKKWDFIFNAYLPLTADKKDTVTKWAEDFGVLTYVQHSQHSGYDRYMQRTDTASAGRGFDIRVGRVIPRFEQAKVYLGGYSFSSTDAKNVTGVLAKITYDITKHTSVEFVDTYDSYNNNKALFGLKLTFGGYSQREKQEFGLSSRLLDPIEHGYINATVPIQTVAGTPVVVDQKPRLRYDNVWFFTPISTTAGNDVAQGDGTYEHPLQGFTTYTYSLVKSVGVITSYPMLYFAPGTYSLSTFQNKSFDGSATWYSAFLLPTGWGMYGTNSGYVGAASGANRATFTGALILGTPNGAATGGNNTIDSVIFNFGATTTGIAVPGIVAMNNAQNVVMNNDLIGADTISAGGYTTGISVVNSTATLTNDEVRSANLDNIVPGTISTSTSTAILEKQGSTVNLAGGNNIISSTNSIYKGGDSSASGSATVTLDASTLNFTGGDAGTKTNVVTAQANTPNGSNSEIRGIMGISATNSSTVNFVNGVNTVQATGNADTSAKLTYTVYAIAATSNSVINFINGQNTSSAYTPNASAPSSYTPSESFTRGLSLSSNATVNFVNGTNTIRVQAMSPIAGVTLPHVDGIGSYGAVINFNGGTNNISATFSPSVDLSAGNDVSGIDLYDGNGSYGKVVNFNGGKNTLSATTSGRLSEAYGIYSGIPTYGSNTVNFNNGSDNTINASVMTGPTGSSNLSLSNGIYAAGASVINFNTGSVNTINAMGNNIPHGFGYVDGAPSTALPENGIVGINVAGTTQLNFNGGGNNIYASIYNPTPPGWQGTINTSGIVAKGTSSINFTSGAQNTIRTTVDRSDSGYGKISYGIYAYSGVNINANGAPIPYTSIPSYFISITRVGSLSTYPAGSGSKISWGTNLISW